MSTTGVVLLAAGQSERYGGDKRLASISGRDGSLPMLLATLEQINASGLPVFVVLRPGDVQWEQELDQRGIEWGTCPDAALGMGHSLAFGVHATQQWQHWLIALADMPFVQPQTYRVIANALEQHAIVRPVVHEPSTGQYFPGHPVGFQQRFACELMRCNGDVGARDLLQRYAGDVHALVVTDDGILRDIDRPEDRPDERTNNSPDDSRNQH